MVEFGDELMIESYRIPWLIWIQFLVMVLLFIVLFFGISVLNSDASSCCDETAASPSASCRAAQPIPLTDSISSHNIVKEEAGRAMTDAGTNDSENNAIDDESSMKNSIFMRFFRHTNHPCNYIGLVRRAIFKCFGMDSSSENSNCHTRNKTNSVQTEEGS